MRAAAPAAVLLLLPQLAGAEEVCAKQREAVEEAEGRRLTLQKGMRVSTRDQGNGALEGRYEEKGKKGKKGKKGAEKWWVKLDSGELAIKAASQIRADGEAEAVAKRWTKLGNCLAKNGAFEEARAAMEMGLDGAGAEQEKPRAALRKVHKHLTKLEPGAGAPALLKALGHAAAHLSLWEGSGRDAAAAHWDLWTKAVEGGAVPSLGPVRSSADVNTLSSNPHIVSVDGYLTEKEYTDLRDFVFDERRVRERRYRVEDRQWCFDGDDARKVATKDLGASLDGETGCTQHGSPPLFAGWRKKHRPRDVVYLQKGVDPRLDRILWRFADEWKLPFALSEQAVALRYHQSLDDSPLPVDGSACDDGAMLTAALMLDDAGELRFPKADVTVPFRKGRLVLWRRRKDDGVTCHGWADVQVPPAQSRRDAVFIHFAAADRYAAVAQRDGIVVPKTVKPSVSLGPLVPTATHGRADTTVCSGSGRSFRCRHVVGKPEIGNEQQFVCSKFNKCSSCTRAGCTWCVSEGKCVVHFLDAPPGHKTCKQGEMDQAGHGGSGNCDSSLWPSPERRKLDRHEYGLRFQVPPKMKIDWYSSGGASTGGNEFVDEDEFAE